MDAMRIPSKRTAIALAVAVVAIGAGGIAVADSQSGDDERAAFEADLAKRLGVTTDKLEEALKGAASDQVDRALADGKITKEQADELKQRIQSGDGPGLGRFHGPGPGFGFRGPGFLGRPFEGAAKYLGLSEAELRDELTSGKSLADVAKEKGKSVDGLEQAIVDAATSRLDAAVKAGDLTDAQRDRILERLKANVDDLVNGRLDRPRRGFFHHHW
jgi:hypothetical protein